LGVKLHEKREFSKRIKQFFCNYAGISKKEGFTWELYGKGATSFFRNVFPEQNNGTIR
jgi:hypothetical protein